MAISYPRELPPEAIASEIDVRPQWVTSQIRSRSGVMQAVETADPFWSFKITTPSRNYNQMEAVQAWWDSLRGGMKTFLGYRVGRCWPKAYQTEAAVLSMTRFGGGSFNGTTSVSSVTANTISVGSSSPLPAGFVMKAGDHIGLVKAGSPNNSYSLHVTTEDAVANGSGVMTVQVEPKIATNIFGSGCTAVVVRAKAEFVPEPDSWSGTLATSFPGASLSAKSVIRAV